MSLDIESCGAGPQSCNDCPEVSPKTRDLGSNHYRIVFKELWLSSITESCDSNFQSLRCELFLCEFVLLHKLSHLFARRHRRLRATPCYRDRSHSVRKTHRLRR